MRVAAFLVALVASPGALAAFLNLDVIPDGTLETVETATVQVGDVFDVDVVAGDVTGLAGFEFVLSFDPTKVVPVPATTGVFSSADVFDPFGFEIVNGAGPDLGQVQFAELSLGPIGVDLISTVLGTVSFEAIAPTNPPFSLELSDVVLSDESALQIAGVQTNTASITVVPRSTGTAPLPGTLALAAVGLAALGLRRYRPR